MPNTETHAGSAGERERRMTEPETKLISIEGNPLSRWILIHGNRWAVSAVALILVGLGFVGSGMIWPEELVTLFTEEQVVQTTLIALFSGIILLVSIAVSVNSIVLSQEITALDEQKEAIDQTFSFRDSVREQTDADVSPVHPAAFLQVLFDAIRTNAEELHESIPDDEGELHRQVELIKDDIVRQVDEVEGGLTKGAFGTSEVLFVGIQYDYSRQVNAVRQLGIDYEGTLTDHQREKIDGLLATLKYLAIGREYFKTLYFKKELANLSRSLLVIAFPAIVFLAYALLSIRAGFLPEFSIFGIPSIIWFVGLTYIVGMAPYTLFSTYVLRTATISIKTLAAGPFVIGGSGGSRPLGETDEST